VPRRRSPAPAQQKVKPLDDGDKVGASFGVTLNMGDYQSLRIEGWIETTKRPGETSHQAFERAFSVAEREANRKAREYKS
jgi:hypothetical protein